MFATLASKGTLHRLDRPRGSIKAAGISIDNSTAFAPKQLATGVPALSGLRSNPLNLSGSCQRREYPMSSAVFVVSASPLASVLLGIRRVSIIA